MTVSLIRRPWARPEPYDTANAEGSSGEVAIGVPIVLRLPDSDAVGSSLLRLEEREVMLVLNGR